MLEHAKRYSPYGVGFSKPFIFATGGGHAYYVRGDHFDKEKWNEEVFATPFWPSYRPDELKNNNILNKKNVDYSHEREWRVPQNLDFQYEHIEFIILNTYEDMAQFPRELKDSIGRKKFLLMENYRQIKRIWPVHNIET
ncbi:MAG: hypothetical protein SVR94_16070 [Pseudomonadota bacterium]|nr:hypothetical protein [Pseudomonadota bacterium]